MTLVGTRKPTRQPGNIPPTKKRLKENHRLPQKCNGRPNGMGLDMSPCSLEGRWLGREASPYVSLLLGETEIKEP